MKIIIFLLSLFLFSLFFLRHEALLISQYYSKKRYLMTLFQEYKKRMTKSFYLFFFPLLFFLLFFLKSEYVTILFLCGWLIYYLLSPSFMPLKKTRRSLTLFFFSIFYASLHKAHGDYLLPKYAFCTDSSAKRTLASSLAFILPISRMYP